MPPAHGIYRMARRHRARISAHSARENTKRAQIQLLHKSITAIASAMLYALCLRSSAYLQALYDAAYITRNTTTGNDRDGKLIATIFRGFCPLNDLYQSLLLALPRSRKYRLTGRLFLLF